VGKSPYLGVDIQKHLETLSGEAKALAGSRIIQTDEGRSIMLLLQRLIETLATGAPTTEAQKRHHQ
jgi:hypothetical protein